MQQKTVVQGVSLPEEMLDAAKERAARGHRSLSGYIRSLIEEDLRGAGEVAPKEVPAIDRPTVAAEEVAP